MGRGAVKRQWFGVGRLAALACVFTTALALLASPAAVRATAPGRLYAQNACTPVYASPSPGSTLMTQLIGGSQVTAVQALAASGASWELVRIWSGIQGYVLTGDMGPQPPDTPSEGDCAFPGLPDTPSAPIPADAGPAPFAHQGVAGNAATLYSRPDAGSLPLAALAVGAPIQTKAWTAGPGGMPWYQVTAGASGWMSAVDVRLDAPDTATRVVNGAPIWTPVAGKGMWFTNYLAHHSDMDTLMRAAKQAGITHLYAEVAITQYGFYGRDSLDRLLPAAHREGISVIAWIYPTLADISADIRMTQSVFAYAGPHGERPDGYAMDIEEVDDAASVYAYGQVARALTGPDTLLVAAVFHPYAQTYYPYAAIATSWNVLAPMDYWHSRRGHAYSPQDVRTFVSNSLMTIRASTSALGAATPLAIEELGQTYDMYSNDGVDTGNAPTGAEVAADLRTAKDYGCIGASFFEWQTASQDQWSAVAQFQW